ncbi:MAG: 30S ribosomal protein S13 [Planctomycetota bacterium]
MPRIAGVDVPHGKKIMCALTYIHGIGPKTADDICKACNIDLHMRAKDLTQEEIQRIVQYIDANLVIEGALKRAHQISIQRLKDINCYRGMRHRKNLPCRGQRTRTNARTRKGPKKTVAVKRSVKAL